MSNRTFNIPNGVKVAYFPPEFVTLSQEIIHHPVLIDLLQDYPADEDSFELRLAGIAAYCEIMLDGDYMPDDIVRIAKMCTQRLQDKRKKVIIQNGEIV